MNKYQEAYSYIKHYCELDDDFLKWPLAEISIKAFKELVDRATPKKAIIKSVCNEVDCDVDYGACPNCEYPLDYSFNYCPECGQVLDWSDENE